MALQISLKEDRDVDRKLLIYNFAPAIIGNLLFLPFWFIPSSFLAYNISMLQTLFNVAVLPIYLVILNFRAARREGDHRFLPYIGTMWSAILVANVISYFNWGVATDQLWMPEFGTIYLYEWLLIISFGAVLVLTLIGQLALNFTQRENMR